MPTRCKRSGIREARDIESGKRAILREVGTYEGVSTVRKATEEDIAWVKGMGGSVQAVNG